jgi:uncharacterized membrane protein YqjE
MATQDNTYPAAGAQPAAAQGSGDNLLDLVRQLAGQGSHLAEQQLALIQAEIREGIGDIKASIGGMVGAAVVGIAGLGVVLMGLAYLLADAIDDLGLATLIVGVVSLVIAYVLYAAARKKIDAAHLSPDRTRRTLAHTPDIVHGDLHTEPKS